MEQLVLYFIRLCYLLQFGIPNSLPMYNLVPVVERLWLPAISCAVVGLSLISKHLVGCIVAAGVVHMTSMIRSKHESFIKNLALESQIFQYGYNMICLYIAILFVIRLITYYPSKGTTILLNRKKRS